MVVPDCGPPEQWDAGSQIETFDMRLQRELARRTLLLKLALLAWKEEHGEYPEELDELAGQWPDALVDPYSGAEFGYRPKGTQEIRFRNPDTRREEFVAPGGAFFWSAWVNDTRIVPAGRSAPGLLALKLCDWRGPINDPRSQIPAAFVFTLP